MPLAGTAVMSLVTDDILTMAPPPRARRGGDLVLETVDHPFDVHREDTVYDRPVRISDQPGGFGSGVVDRAVEAAVQADGPRDERLDRRLVDDVGLDEREIPVGGEGLRQYAPATPADAGDQYDLPVYGHAAPLCSSRSADRFGHSPPRSPRTRLSVTANDQLRTDTTSSAACSPERRAPSIFPFHTAEVSVPAQCRTPTGARRAAP